MAEATIKFEMDTTACQGMIDETIKKFVDKCTLENAESFVKEHELKLYEPIERDADGKEFGLPEVLHWYMQSLFEA